MKNCWGFLKFRCVFVADNGNFSVGLASFFVNAFYYSALACYICMFDGVWCGKMRL